jgi:tetratricopeptide (TPR) repeat protein
MTDVIERARPVIEQYGSPEQRGLFFLTVCLRDLARDRYVVSEETVLYCRHALATVSQTDDTNLLGFAQFALGTCLLWSGHLDGAEEHLQRAMHIGERIGNIMLRVRCLTFLPFIYRQRGQVEAVRAMITQVLALPETETVTIIMGHRVWLAWRDGNLTEAEAYARATLNDWRHHKYLNSFYWTSVLPLLAIVFERENIAEAMEYVRILLDSSQQPVVAKLQNLLETALQVWNAGRYEQTCNLLRQALPVAKEFGYL